MKKTGVLAAVFSLPGAYGIGDLGRCSYEFVDQLAAAGMKIWQVLPMNPVGGINSPYQPYSSYAGETVYIDLEALYEAGLLKEKPEALESSDKVDYPAVRSFKDTYFREAFKNFKAEEDPEYQEFIKQEWVRAYAEFAVLLKRNKEACWNEWKKAKKTFTKTEEKEIQLQIFLQYMFSAQWKKLKAYANKKKVKIMGDIPFYVGMNSQDVFDNPEEFLLDSKGYPLSVAGVPPDYFSATGQRWGNPIYNWPKMEENQFTFYRNRIKAQADMFDMLRIDHFRAFDTYWVIPAECPTAIEGEWLEAPGYDFFNILLPEIPKTKIVAEDLGMMRKEVYKLRDHFRFPGMNVIQFTFFDKGFKYKKNMITYTGTHDNDTVKGWYKSLKRKEKSEIKTRFAEAGIKDKDISLAFMRYAMTQKPDYVIFLLQDVLGLDTEARTNRPGIVCPDNWVWKMTDMELLKKRMPKIIKLLNEQA